MYTNKQRRTAVAATTPGGKVVGVAIYFYIYSNTPNNVFLH